MNKLIDIKTCLSAFLCAVALLADAATNDVTIHSLTNHAVPNAGDTFLLDSGTNNYNTTFGQLKTVILTNLPAGNLQGTAAAINGTAITNLSASQLAGAIPYAVSTLITNKGFVDVEQYGAVVGAADNAAPIQACLNHAALLGKNVYVPNFYQCRTTLTNPGVPFIFGRSAQLSGLTSDTGTGPILRERPSSSYSNWFMCGMQDLRFYTVLGSNAVEVITDAGTQIKTFSLNRVQIEKPATGVALQFSALAADQMFCINLNECEIQGGVRATNISDSIRMNLGKLGSSGPSWDFHAVGGADSSGLWGVNITGGEIIYRQGLGFTIQNCYLEPQNLGSYSSNFITAVSYTPAASCGANGLVIENNDLVIRYHTNFVFFDTSTNSIVRGNRIKVSPPGSMVTQTTNTSNLKLYDLNTTASSPYYVERHGSGTTPGDDWGISVQNAAANDAARFGQVSSDATGNVRAWLIANATFTSYPSVYRVGTGTNSGTFVEFSGASLTVPGTNNAGAYHIGGTAGMTTNINVLVAGGTTNQLQFTSGILTGVVPQ